MKKTLWIGLVMTAISAGCATTKDPIVGTWKEDDVMIICNADGTGLQRFDRPNFYKINKTYEGSETKLRWEKKKPDIYVIHYLYSGRTVDQPAQIKDGDLVFDHDDYETRFKR